MALYECRLTVNKTLKGLQPHGNAEFPCAGYLDRLDGTVTWHWHGEIEIAYVESGAMEVKAPPARFTLGEGQCAAVNANVLHYYAPASECVLRTLLFSPDFITGGGESVFARKYMTPLTSCRAFSAYPMRGAEGGEARLCFNRAFGTLAQEPPGFEFVVRENLSRICFLLHSAFEAAPAARDARSAEESARVRRMLGYIHKNFARGVLLSEIARAGGVSERECLRCFQKVIRTSPVQYLIKYRVTHGAELLAHDRAASISDVAALCAFDSPSNFAKLFKRFYSCTPREYRNRRAAEI